ncbi:MAG: hypothetical protein HZB26_15730 [Candidatus Hydrogenedentes bacterium]|nr:hypothetical protein [Candidatus Hydrogenedentota bacterium]
MNNRNRHSPTLVLSICIIVLAACSSPKNAPTGSVSTPEKSPGAALVTPTSPAPPPPLQAPQAAPAVQDPTESVTVYVTAKGKNYHSDGCKFLWRSKNPLTLKDAVAKGYKACVACKPPTLDTIQASPPSPPPLPKAETAAPPKKGLDSSKTATPSAAQTTKTSEETKADTVYVTKNGKKFHLATCRYVAKGRIALSRADATAKGYAPCPLCKP